MSDLRDDPTPWHRVGDVVDEVDRLRELVGKLDAARADAEILHRGASRQLWEARREAEELRQKERTARHRWADALRRVQQLEDAIAAHRDALADASWPPKACDTGLWEVLGDR